MSRPIRQGKLMYSSSALGSRQADVADRHGMAGAAEIRFEAVGSATTFRLREVRLVR
ncbi:hypothetical protein [Streptomyces coeruleorubidus]|uniref:hypothetical protein n=1 Tax=Streptomyces coeruleorubidus TaxID=116188 RepID=UPI0037AC2BF7